MSGKITPPVIEEQDELEKTDQLDASINLNNMNKTATQINKNQKPLYRKMKTKKPTGAGGGLFMAAENTLF